MTTVRIPPTLRTETGGERQVQVQGGTVRELLDDLVSRFPGLRTQLVEDGEVAPFVNVYLEGEDVRTLEAGFETPVREGSTVILLPAMAGGAKTSWRDEFARVDRSFQTDAHEAGGRTGKAGTACRRRRKRSRGRARPDGGTASSA